MNRLETRLDKLENANPGPTLLAWRDQGETDEQAEARFFAENPGVDPRRVIILSWMGEDT